MAQPAIGDIAPDFNLPEDLNGTLTLSSLRGQKVVLFFYPKDDTSGCTKESIAFSSLKAEFEKADTVIVGISPDTVAKHQKFRTKHNLTTLLVADEERTALEAYGVWVQKSMYGRKYMGVERTTFLIDREGKIAQIWNKVKVAGHAEAVLAEAQTL
ncbi:peroxiredoxin Q/BCP [Paenochrobactrum gallinarii]|uniref:thioredoxin-dependent peroxiredoxin n=1 Tax=Paenochrobactrum gallinarii TaxID=643673 RepID=A0A841LZU9_9HYPH|nr:peroxiredoxin [Paenochrobactrum gallinarii]MBB6259661.1 peroxiredoxin Q/BCP [Paenochrobactrum gallinarii]